MMRSIPPADDRSDTPFLALSAPLLRRPAHGADARPELTPAQSPEPAPDAPSSPKIERAYMVFEAAVNAVHARLNHLSREAIYHPPHGWSDATLARQIAVHVAIRQMAVPNYHLAEAFQRSRESLHRALHAVEDRIAADDAFADAYRSIAAQAEHNYRTMKEANLD